MNQKYVIITPVRDEEKYIEGTIRSVISQTIEPAQWVIVDDGSTDNSGAIIDEYATKVSWMTVLHRKDRGFRLSGGGVMQAFYEGYQAISCHDWEFLVKLDGDLSFAADYFQRALQRFAEEPRLGIGGGTIHHLVADKEEAEVSARFQVRGATKIYRRQCWDTIGGLWRGSGWDTIDQVTANMLGWRTESFPELRVLHHRYTGTGDTDWHEACKNGIGSYCSGYHPLYMAARCLYRTFHKPYVIAALGMFYGYLSGYLKRLPQNDNRQMIKYLRTQQLARLYGGKSIWK